MDVQGLMNVNHNQPKIDDLYRIEDFIARHENFLSIGQLRTHLLHRDTNGLAEIGAVIKLGRIIFINEPKMLEWALEYGRE